MEILKFTEELHIKPETEGFIRFCYELTKKEDQFCLYVEFRKSFFCQVISTESGNIESVNRIERELIPCMDIIHEDGFIRVTPIYRDGFKNYISLSVCRDSAVNYETYWSLYCDTLKIINKANVSLEAFFP